MSTYRRRNRSRAFRAIEAETLASTLTCEGCEQAAPAELHLASGCHLGTGDHRTDAARYLADERVALCRACHDLTGCPAHVGETHVTRWIEQFE